MLLNNDSSPLSYYVDILARVHPFYKDMHLENKHCIITI